MNIVEALKIAKEQGKKVRLKGHDCWSVEYKDGMFLQYYKNSDAPYIYWTVVTEDVLTDWEVVKEKPSKQTQYKIDSMKFQIVRHCKNTTVNDNTNCTKCIITEICDKTFNKNGETPYNNALDGWRLKEIVEAYHILKEAGEI